VKNACFLSLLVLVSCAEERHAPLPASWPNGAAQPDPGFVQTGSLGCGKAAPAGAHTQKVTALGKPRTFTLVVPSGYQPKTAYPVVFGLHGNGGNANAVRASLDLERHAKGQAIFVYPEGIGGGWDLDNEASKNRDVALFDAILLSLHQSLCVDERRIFVTGFSNGAYMANQLACRRGERIRAVATHAGGGPYENTGATYDDHGHLVCPGKAVAALVVHGSSDGTVAPSEGQKSIDHWSSANRCSGGSSPSGPSACVSMNGCVQPVVACKVPGLGHGMWPEGKRMTWSFFDSLR
jgi:polyhydroxybutyrate depolymerase